MRYETCGGCKYHEPPSKNGTEDWTCGNEDSDFYGLPTEYKDTCEEFEERDY